MAIRGRRKKQLRRHVEVDVNHELVGTIAEATSGRESGGLFVIIGAVVPTEDGCRRVCISDGKHRRISSPKLKSLRHIRPIGRDERTAELIRRGECSDGEIRRTIRRMESKAQIRPKGESNAEG